MRHLLVPMLLLFLFAVPMGVSAKISISNKKLSLPAGQAFQLKLDGLTGMEQSIRWKVKDEEVAEVDPFGAVTAKGRGSTKVIAVVDGTKYRCKLTVTQPVTDIQLSKTTKKLVKGKSFRLKAAISPADADNTGIVWKSSDLNVAKVSPKGKVTALGAGSATITACAADGSGVEAVCEVTVRLAAMKLNMTQLTLEVGKKANLKATEGYTYVWATSDKTIAAVSKKGKVKGKREGKAVIVAKRVEDGQSVICYVTVLPAEGTQTETGGSSSKAAQLLALLEKYNQKLQSDKAAGIRWIYGGDCRNSWAEVLAQSESGEVHLSCTQPARWGLRELGIIGAGDFKGVIGGGFRIVDRAQFDEHCIIIKGYKKASELIADGTLQPGDICSYTDMQHTNVYAGDGRFYDSGRMGSNGSWVDGKYIFSTLGPITNPQSLKIGEIVRIVR